MQNELAKRFPGLRGLPALQLAARTPVERLEALSKEHEAERWVKRDDLTSKLYGGNKVRKLEYLLADAKASGARSLIASGAFGSHHVLATTMFGSAAGFSVDAILVPQPWNEHVEENLRVGLKFGLRPHSAPSFRLAPTLVNALRIRRALSGQKPYVVPYGGSDAIGARGYVNAALEVGAQIDACELPEPAEIVVAMGSGGTAAGLAVGLAAMGLTTKIRAVLVTPDDVCNESVVTNLIQATVAALRNEDPSFPAVERIASANVIVDRRFFGRSYGSEEAFTRRSNLAAPGIEFDPTYTARAFAAVATSRNPGPVLYWHTLSSVKLHQHLQDAPRLPDWLAKHAR